MHERYRLWLQSYFTRSTIVRCCLVCFCCLLSFLFLHYLLLATPSAKIVSITRAPSLEVTTGFDYAYRTDYWTPVRVMMNTSSSGFQGTLSVHAYTGSSQIQTFEIASPWSFNQSVALPPNTHKQLTLYAPHYEGNLIMRGFIATLYDDQNHMVVTQASQPGFEVKPSDIFVGVLSNQNAIYKQLDKVLLPNQSNSLTVSSLNTDTLPALETVLENFDVIIIDDFPTRTLSAHQLSALKTWVNRGGTLIEVGGKNWQSTLAPLPQDLLPVSIQSTQLLPPNTHLLSFDGYAPGNPGADTLQTPLIISRATQHRQSTFSLYTTILSTQDTPLLVQVHQGAGVISYLGLDPADQPLATWSGAPVFWQTILQRALGDKLLISNTSENYDSGPGQLLTRGGILTIINPDSPQGPIFIGLLVIGYLLALGPVRFLLVRRYPRLYRWKGRILLGSILISSLLTYGLATYQKDTAITNNSVSLIQLNQDGSSAHITTYMGVLIPRRGDFRVSIPGENLIEPISNAFLAKNMTPPTARDDISATVHIGTDETNMTINNQQLWSLNPVITEADRQLQGKLSTHLTIRNNTIVGTITNLLSIPLSDVYLLLPHNFMPIGHLGTGETRSIKFLLHDDAPSSEQTLADQIAKHNGLSTQYFPYQLGQSPRNDLQQHMTLLSALSGVGYSLPACSGSCLTHAITSKGIIYVTGGQIPDPNLKNDYDPLLIPGASATLIGWADRPVDGQDDTTINGFIPQGTHTNFIQMPLNIDFSGLLNVPRDFISGNLVNINSYDAAAILPGAYSMSTGTLTFELPLPDMSRVYISSLTVTVPDLIAHPSGPSTGSPPHMSNIQIQLYNWQTHDWETVKLTQDAFTTTTPDAYTGPYGRVLVQVTSKVLNQIYFGKPLLNFNGSAVE